MIRPQAYANTSSGAFSVGCAWEVSTDCETVALSFPGTHFGRSF